MRNPKLKIYANREKASACCIEHDIYSDLLKNRNRKKDEKDMFPNWELVTIYSPATKRYKEVILYTAEQFDRVGYINADAYDYNVMWVNWVNFKTPRCLSDSSVQAIALLKFADLLWKNYGYEIDTIIMLDV